MPAARTKGGAGTRRGRSSGEVFTAPPRSAHRDAEDSISGHEALHDVDPRGNLPECGVAPFETGLRRQRDEPLAPAGVLSREGHPHGAHLVREIVVLARDRIAGTAPAVAAGAAVLHDEVRDHPVEREPVEVPRTGGAREILD